jgi:capsular polysaccharide export protein
VRCHPYDRGHRSYRDLVATVAWDAGVAARVHLMQSGHGPTLLMHAQGLITVNSTMALSAMHHGCPVYALGESFYQIPGLVAPGEGEPGLDAFWRAPPAIDAVLFQAFVARLRRQILINGSYYRRKYWPKMTQQVLRRLATDRANTAKPLTMEAAEQPPRSQVEFAVSSVPDIVRVAASGRGCG